MTTQRNIQDLHSLLEYDGQVFIGLFPDEKLLYCVIPDSVFSDESYTPVWEILDCRDCLDLLAAYLLGKATLYQIYQCAPKTYEQELPSGELISVGPPDEQEAPFEESLLYYPVVGVFSLAFPGRDPASVMSYCDREGLIEAAVEKRLGIPEVKNENFVFNKNEILTSKKTITQFCFDRSSSIPDEAWSIRQPFMDLYLSVSTGINTRLGNHDRVYESSSYNEMQQYASVRVPISPLSQREYCNV